jgi:hypothetical protein
MNGFLSESELKKFLEKTALPKVGDKVSWLNGCLFRISTKNGLQPPAVVNRKSTEIKNASEG